MTKFNNIAIAAGIAALVAASPALAGKGNGNNGNGNGNGGNNGGGNNVTLVDANCNLVTGCKFDGNIHDGASAALTQAAYNGAKSPAITLNYIGASDAGFGTVTGGASGSGTWTLNGYTVDYIAVKSGPAFMLYSVAPGNFNYSTAGLQNGNNTSLPGLSHLAFFGSLAVQGVPEPATWALLIGGFGFVGYSARRRQSLKATLA